MKHISEPHNETLLQKALFFYAMPFYKRWFFGGSFFKKIIKHSHVRMMVDPRFLQGEGSKIVSQWGRVREGPPPLWGVPATFFLFHLFSMKNECIFDGDTVPKQLNIDGTKYNLSACCTRINY